MAARIWRIAAYRPRKRRRRAGPQPDSITTAGGGVTGSTLTWTAACAWGSCQTEGERGKSGAPKKYLHLFQRAIAL
jgi:hypothetical protein